ncbi:uncharacterized protein CXorf65 homolog [Aplysia californica]|uniref:Uncharacterized protein CXorf65 homolog n=1 Tax=Aplysia californica TaxID=6500 RepID=A0ABM0ZVM6_APLCA|nr:uncharacterized protein CXorf65 homolog [Aplysia californica]
MSREPSGLMSDPSFVVIKYGDDQEALINPFCSTYIFLDWIRRICNCGNDISIDLVDLEGQLRHLPVSTDEYATEYVTSRETYVVIRVERQGDYGPNKYISLLNDLDKLNPELLVKLNNLSRPGTRSSKRDRGKKTPSRSSRNSNNNSNNNSNSKHETTRRPTSSERNGRSKQGK